MVQRTVYVGATLHVIVRLPVGDAIQVAIANTGSAGGYGQGTPVCVHVPPDALRVLSGSPGGRPAGAESDSSPAPALATAPAS
jgi:TOBE domain